MNLVREIFHGSLRCSNSPTLCTTCRMPRSQPICGLRDGTCQQEVVLFAGLQRQEEGGIWLVVCSYGQLVHIVMRMLFDVFGLQRLGANIEPAPLGTQIAASRCGRRWLCICGDTTGLLRAEDAPKPPSTSPLPRSLLQPTHASTRPCVCRRSAAVGRDPLARTTIPLASRAR